MDGKEITYNLHLCSQQKCSDDYDQLTFIGEKVLFHKTVGSPKGAVARLGLTTELPEEDVQNYLSEPFFNTPTSSVVKQSGQITVTYLDGQLVTKLDQNQEIYSSALHEYIAYLLRKMVRITLTDCGTCSVSEASFSAAMDGEEVLTLRLQSSSMCLVRTIPAN